MIILQKYKNIKNGKLELLKIEKIAIIPNQKVVIFIKYCQIIKTTFYFLLLN